MATYRISKKDFSVIVKSRLSYYEQINERELNYLSQNQIPGLFQIAYDGKNRLMYQAPPAVSMKKYLKNHRLNESSFWNIVSQMINTAIAVESRGLSVNHLLMEKDLVFIQEDTLTMFFIFQPVVSPHLPAELFPFLHDMVYQEIKNGGGMQQEYLINFQNYLQQSGYKLTHVRSYIEQEAPWLKADSHTYPSEQEAHESTQIKRSGYERHTMPLGGCRTSSQPVQNVTASLEERISIVRMKDGKRTELSATVTSLGRSPQNQYCIEGNPAIGRKHAVIEKRTDGYYITDEGSVNRTYLNHMPLNADQPYLLHHGDTIRLADEDFMVEFFEGSR